MNYKEDGITHINIYSKGSTELGRFLTNFAHSPFNHPEDGYFASVEAYWYWLGCKNDVLRDTYGFRAKQLGRELKVSDWHSSDTEFKRKIILAIKTKIDSYPTMKEKFLTSTLPFTHYYVYGGKVVNVPSANWIIKAIEDLRRG